MLFISGVTLGSYLKFNSYQKPPPIMSAPMNPSFFPSSNEILSGSPTTIISLPCGKPSPLLSSFPFIPLSDVNLPVYGRPTERVFIAKSTTVSLHDRGPNNRYIALPKGQLLDARGIDLCEWKTINNEYIKCVSASVLPQSSQIPRVSRPSNLIPDVIELDWVY